MKVGNWGRGRSNRKGKKPRGCLGISLRKISRGQFKRARCHKFLERKVSTWDSTTELCKDDSNMKHVASAKHVVAM